MPAYRCSDCGISYPTDYSKFGTCPIHGTKNNWFGHTEPDEDWAEQLAVMHEHLAEPETLDDIIPLVDTKVHVRNGGYFVLSWDVYDVVRARLQPGMLIRVGKQAFEVLEYLEDSREYWLRPFSTTLSEEDLARLAAG